MPLNIIRHDITEMDNDAIVNAANSELAHGGGVCGAIFAKAGIAEMKQACARIGHCPVGGAVITPGFGLKAKYVIHAVGPVWRGGSQGEAQLLRSAYRSSLNLAIENGLESIAFPLISAGIYDYPRPEAFAIALDVFTHFLMEHELDIILVLFGDESYRVGLRMHKDLVSYIDDHYVSLHEYPRFERQKQSFDVSQPSASINERESIRLMSDKKVVIPEETTFSEALLKLIDAKGLTDVEAYKRSNIDRKLFSKIRSNKYYTPTKSTVLAFAIGLRLSVPEAEELLARAGFAFSPWFKRDLIVRWFLENEEYDIHMVNAELYNFDQELLRV